MKPKCSAAAAVLALTGLALTVCSCGLPFVGTEYAVHKVRSAVRAISPDPESRWNKYGWWQRVSDKPATYVPREYPVAATLTERHGAWFIDERDGKRLFVPKGNKVLTADARVITTTNRAIKPLRFDRQSRKENLAEVFPYLSGKGSFGGGSYSIGRISAPTCGTPGSTGSCSVGP